MEFGIDKKELTPTLPVIGHDQVVHRRENLAQQEFSCDRLYLLYTSALEILK